MLAIEHLKKTYQAANGEVPAIADISFTLNQGQFLSIVGPSGCGKSTLLSMIAGLEAKSGGSVTLNGRPIIDSDHAVGYMLQKDYLLPWRTIYKNICLGLEITHKCDPDHLQYIDCLITTYGLAEFKDKYPSQLSGGMRQRAALIRTLAVRPKLLLLDEAFSALDYHTRQQVTDDIHHILKHEGITTILVTHDIPESICMGDFVLVLSKRPARVKSLIATEMTEIPTKRRGDKRFELLFDRIWREMNENEAR